MRYFLRVGRASERRAKRALLCARGLLGVSLLVAPGRGIALLAGRASRTRERRFVRLLGLRHVAQAVLMSRTDDRRAQLAGVGVDALHGATMAGLAIVSPTERRPACASALVALLLMTGGARDAWRGCGRR